MASIQNFI